MNKQLKELYKFRDIVKEFTNDVKNGKIKEQVINEAKNQVYDDLYQICDSAVDRWYAAYKPRFYKRQNSLYNAYRISKHDSYIEYEFDYKFIDDTDHRVSNKYIFELMFMYGWHGGATSINEEAAKKYGEHPNEGTPWYRTKPPVLANMVGEPRYMRWSRNMAVHTPSAYLQIKKGISDYKNGIVSKYNNTGHVLSNVTDDAFDIVFNRYNINYLR